MNQPNPTAAPDRRAKVEALRGAINFKRAQLELTPPANVDHHRHARDLRALEALFADLAPTA